MKIKQTQTAPGEFTIKFEGYAPNEECFWLMAYLMYKVRYPNGMVWYEPCEEKH